MANKCPKIKLSEKAIRNMPYDSRIRMYQKEKEELFAKAKDYPGEELERLHKELAKKWRV